MRASEDPISIFPTGRHLLFPLQNPWVSRLFQTARAPGQACCFRAQEPVPFPGAQAAPTSTTKDRPPEGAWLSSLFFSPFPQRLSLSP